MQRSIVCTVKVFLSSYLDVKVWKVKTLTCTERLCETLCKTSFWSDIYNMAKKCETLNSSKIATFAISPFMAIIVISSGSVQRMQLFCERLP